MGFNGPNNNGNGKGKDPWSGKGQPPDLEELFKKLHQNLKSKFTGNKNKLQRNTNSDDNNLWVFLGLFSVIAFILWFLSGIFIVDPAEQAAILRFGKYVETVGPGPHWIPRFIETKNIVNVDRVADYSYSSNMLTKDENLVSVSVVVQYRIGDLEQYLFNVSDPIESLQQATSSALRQVIGHTSLDEIITEGRDVWGGKVLDTLTNILQRYKPGIVIVNVSPQPARAPESVQDAFDDAIKAQEDEKRFIEQARAYEAQVVPIAKGNAQRLLSEAKANAQQVVLNASGETAEFLKLLPVYVKSPWVTSQRLYLDIMQKVLTKSSKVVVNGKGNNLLYLPIDKLISSSNTELLIQGSTASETENNKEDNSFDGRNLMRPLERWGRSKS